MSQTPSKREWRTQVCEVHEDGAVIPDGQAAAAAMLELGAILTRIGGMAAVSAERIKLDNGEHVTTHLRFAYQTFAPLPPQEHPPEPQQAAPNGRLPADEASAADIAAAAAAATPPPPPAPEPEPEPVTVPDVAPGSADAQALTREERVTRGL